MSCHVVCPGSGVPSTPPTPSTTPPPPVVHFATASRDFPMTLHKALLCTAFNFDQKETFALAHEVAVLRLEELASSSYAAEAAAVVAATEGGGGEPAGHVREALAAAAEILGSIVRLEREPGTESLRAVSATLLACCPAPTAPGAAAGGAGRATTTSGTAATSALSAGPGGWIGRHLLDVLVDASLILYAAARPLLDGAFCARDKESELVLVVLRSLHACWEACDLDDAPLRVAGAVKLALLLEDAPPVVDALFRSPTFPATFSAGSGTIALLYEAKEVLGAAARVAARARGEMMAAGRGAEDEYVRWITASRNQPSDATAALVAGMTDTEQVREGQRAGGSPDLLGLSHWTYHRKSFLAIFRTPPFLPLQSLL